MRHRFVYSGALGKRAAMCTDLCMRHVHECLLTLARHARTHARTHRDGCIHTCTQVHQYNVSSVMRKVRGARVRRALKVADVQHAPAACCLRAHAYAARARMHDDMRKHPYVRACEHGMLARACVRALVRALVRAGPSALARMCLCPHPMGCVCRHVCKHVCRHADGWVRRWAGVYLCKPV